MSNEKRRPEMVFVDGIPMSEKILAEAVKKANKLRPKAEEAYRYVIDRFPAWKVAEFRDGFWGVQLERGTDGDWVVTYGTNQYPGSGVEVFVGAKFDGDDEETAVPWVRVTYRSPGRDAERNYVIVHMNVRPGTSGFGGIVIVEGGLSAGRFKTFEGGGFYGRLVSYGSVEDLADYLVRSDEIRSELYAGRLTWEQACEQLEAMLAE